MEPFGLGFRAFPEGFHAARQDILDARIVTGGDFGLGEARDGFRQGEGPRWRDMVKVLETGEPPAAPPVEPGEEFRALTEAEVEAGVATLDPENPIAREVARLITAYTANFVALVERLGFFPASVLHVKPRWPIEAVAMRLTSDGIRHAGKDAARRREP